MAAPTLTNWTNLIGNPHFLLFSFDQSIKIGTGTIRLKDYGTDGTDGVVLETYTLTGADTANVFVNTNSSLIPSGLSPVPSVDWFLRINPSLAAAASLTKLTAPTPSTATPPTFTQAQINANSYVIEFSSKAIKNSAGLYFGDGLVTQQVVFTYTDTVNYDFATTTVALTINLLTDDASVKATGSYWDTLIGIQNVIAGPMNDVLRGDALANTLYGRAGNDTLDGRGGSSGNDRLFGGVGNDTYIIDTATEKMVELAGEGTDVVQSLVTWTLGASFENLTLTGTAAINGTGNVADNVLTGNGAGNTLDGGAGNDTLIGGVGNDTYIVDATGDIVTEASTAVGETDEVQSSVTYTLGARLENLTLIGTAIINGTGNIADNVLVGNGASNILNGLAGNDTMMGGTGNDTYIVDATGDVVTETGTAATEIDEVQSSVTYTIGAYIEDLTLTGTAAIDGTGNIADNVLIGNTANNTLSSGAGYDIIDGGAGNDTMIGGTGDDTYFVNATGDTVTENGTAAGETDEVQSSVTYTIGSLLENLVLTGTAVINGTGNIADNVLTGNGASNTLDGDVGNDTMIGGAGNDIYIVDATGDVVTENGTAAGETDEVRSSATYTIGSLLENLTLTGAAAIDGTGNVANNVLTGNTSANTLDGGAGNDTINGGTGNDILTGGTGNDTLTGGGNVDSFNIDAGIDTVTDLSGSDSLIVAAGATVTATLSAAWTIANTLSNAGTGTIIVNNTTTTAFAADLSNSTGANGWTLTNSSSAGVSMTGSNQADTITGGTGADTINGGAGADTINGGAGGDTINGGAGNDTIMGNAGNDTYIVDAIGDTVTENGTAAGETDEVQSAVTYTIGSLLENLTLTGTAVINGTGNVANNVLTGNGASNTLNGLAGNDTMTGGAGNDTYIVDATGDTVTETGTAAGETDEVQSSVTYTIGSLLENLTLTGTAAINGTGNVADNILIGNTGNNTLDGGTGIDTMTGNAGNDIYVVNNINDVLIETSTGGTDTIQSSIDYVLQASSGANGYWIENLTLTGSATSGTGNDLSNTITGNTTLASTLIGGAGNDALNGGSGNGTLDGGVGGDTMTGGAGNDTYIVDSDTTIPVDLIIENASAGTDTVQSGVTINSLATNVENLTLTGSAAINGTGNTSVNIITGNSGNNTLTGGVGSDTLSGGAGKDTYVYASTAQSGDSVAFSVADVDVVNLSAIANLTDSYGEYTISGSTANITVNNNIIVLGTTSAVTIANAATAIAADTTVTATVGYIVIPNGSNTLVYHTTNLANNGTETLMLTLTGVSDASTLTSSMFSV